MANQYLIDININDALPDVIRKVNHNFKTVSGGQSKQTKARIRINDDDIQQAIDDVAEDAERNLNTALTAEVQARNLAINSAINTEAINRNQAIKNALLEAHPIGSLYISTTNANPSTFIGGTWTQINNSFLVAQGTNYSAGATGSVQGGSGSSNLVPWFAVYVWKRTA